MKFSERPWRLDFVLCVRVGRRVCAGVLLLVVVAVVVHAQRLASSRPLEQPPEPRKPLLLLHVVVQHQRRRRVHGEGESAHKERRSRSAIEPHPH
jgi:hypothetical protein